MDKQGKAWGETTLLFNDQRVSLHYLSIYKGGYSSEHKHSNKTNLFYVIEGELLIRFWRKGEQIDETILKAGESMTIPTFIWHQFQALTDCKCLEIYETGLWTDDIERRIVGGSNYDKISNAKKTMGKPSIQIKAEGSNEGSLEPKKETESSYEDEGESPES